MIDTTVDLAELDRMEDDPVEENLVVLPANSAERNLERRMREQMLAYERKKSMERQSSSSGGVTREEFERQRRAQSEALANLTEVTAAAESTPPVPDFDQSQEVLPLDESDSESEFKTPPKKRSAPQSVPNAPKKKRGKKSD